MDAGKVVSLIDKGHLHHIRTVERTYHNVPQDKLMIHIEFGFSKNDSEEKSRIVKSGLRRRMERGYPLGMPLSGFTHTGKGKYSGSAIWVADDDSLKLVRKVFARFLKGGDSLATISEYAKKIGLKSEKRVKLGGCPMSRSAIHRMLTSPIYAGFFFSTNGERKDLAEELPRIITEDEHEKCLQIFSARCVSGPRKQYFFPFYGLIFSDKGERLGVDPKFQLRCDCFKKYSYLSRTHCPYCKKEADRLRHPVYRTYRYYFSRRAKLGRAPSLRSIEENKIRALLITHIKEEIVFPKEFAAWSKKYLHELQDEALRSRRAEARQNDAHKRTLASKRTKLRELYFEGYLEKKEFVNEMRVFNSESEMVRGPDFTLSADWKIEAQKIFDLGAELVTLLQKGSDHEIHRSISTLGITMIWDGQDLTFKHSALLTKVLSLLKMAGHQESFSHSVHLQPKEAVQVKSAQSDDAQQFLSGSP